MRVKSVRALLNAHKFFKSLPESERVQVVSGEYWTRADFLRWFRSCLNAKINRNEQAKGRKDCEAYRQDLALEVER